jgi:hypothetical protein
MIFIQEVTGSSLGQDAGYSEDFMVFLNHLKKLQEQCLKRGHDSIPPSPVSVMTHETSGSYTKYMVFQKELPHYNTWNTIVIFFKHSALPVEVTFNHNYPRQNSVRFAAL